MANYTQGGIIDIDNRKYAYEINNAAVLSKKAVTAFFDFLS